MNTEVERLRAKRLFWVCAVVLILSIVAFFVTENAIPDSTPSYLGDTLSNSGEQAETVSSLLGWEIVFCETRSEERRMGFTYYFEHAIREICDFRGYSDTWVDSRPQYVIVWGRVNYVYRFMAAELYIENYPYPVLYETSEFAQVRGGFSSTAEQYAEFLNGIEGRDDYSDFVVFDRAWPITQEQFQLLREAGFYLASDWDWNWPD